MHSPGFVAATSKEAADEFFPLMGAIELIGTHVAPAVRAKLGAVKT